MQQYQLGDSTSSDWTGCCDPSSIIGQACCAASGQDTTDYTNCSNQADNDPSYTAISSQLATVANWTPTGYYNASDIQAVVQQQQSLATQAISFLTNVGSACAAAPGCESGSLVSQMVANLTLNPNDGTNVMTRAQNYLSAASQAQSGISAIAGSNYVSAPNFKLWVQDSLNAVGSAIHAGLVIQCQMPGWASLAGAIVSASQSFVNFVVGIAGVAANVVQGAVAAGKTVITATETAGGIIGWVLNNLPLVAGLLVLGAGGLYVYRRGWFRRKKSLGHARGHGRFEVEGQLFEDVKRAKAMAKLQSREYGFPVSVSENGRKLYTYAGGHAI